MVNVKPTYTTGRNDEPVVLRWPRRLLAAYWCKTTGARQLMANGKEVVRARRTGTIQDVRPGGPEMVEASAWLPEVVTLNWGSNGRLRQSERVRYVVRTDAKPPVLAWDTLYDAKKYVEMSPETRRLAGARDPLVLTHRKAGTFVYACPGSDPFVELRASLIAEYGLAEPPDDV